MKLTKEYIIVFIIILLIFFLDCITKKVTIDSVNRIMSLSDEIYDEIILVKNNKHNELKTNESIKKLKREWENEQNKLSLFIEHNELEKVSNSMVCVEENFNNELYEEALVKCREFQFWVSHFSEKERLKIKNIF